MTNIKSQASLLIQAEKYRTPLSKGSLNIANPDQAYQIQDRVLQEKIKAGEHLAGYKIALGSPAAQASFHTDQPVYGKMTNARIASDHRLSLSQYIAPKVETEVLFLPQEMLSTRDSDEDLLAKCLIAPAFEIPDGRVEDPSLTDLIADAGMAGAMTWGRLGNYSYQDLDDLKGTLYLNSKEIASGTTRDILGHPVQALRFLLEKLEEKGETLAVNHFVLSGTFIPVPYLKEGHYKLVYDGPLGSCDLEVTK